MKKIKPKDGNDFFCVVPWLHTYVSAQGERRLCCLSTERPTRHSRPIDLLDGQYEKRPDSLYDYWNSEYMMNIRKKMMKGEKLDECKICNNSSLNNRIKHYYTNDLFANKIDEIFDNTDENGMTSIMPISYQYIVSNSCNFKCRTCGDQASSSIENENNKRKVYDKNKPNWLEHKKEINLFQKQFVKKELLDAANDKTIEEINWSGGEPLLWPIHWEVMNILIENKHSKNVTVRYNTNLSKIKHGNQYIYDILKNFKNVHLACSIDGEGKIGEYIRDGLRWDKWIQNFKDCLALNKHFGEWAVYIDLTLTTPGLFSLKEMIDLVSELDVNSSIKSIFSLDSQIVLNPLMIPKNILHEILDDLIDYANEKSKINKKIYQYIQALEKVKNEKTLEEIDNNVINKIKIGKKNMIEMDQYRNNVGVLDNIFSKNKKLISWWRDI